MQTHLTAPSYPNVAMVQADDYSQQTIERAVRRVFAELEISPELFRDKNVLVKPNLLMRRRPEEATTTHPQVMRAVILRLQEMGAKQVVIADSPAGCTPPRSCARSTAPAGCSRWLRRPAPCSIWKRAAPVSPPVTRRCARNLI